MFNFFRFSTPVNASDILGAPGTVRLFLDLKDEKVYNWENETKTDIDITFTYRLVEDYSRVLYREATEEFCRIYLNNPPQDYIKWRDKGSDITSGEITCISDQLRRWNPEVYDCTCLHPEFPHLISGWQAAIER